LAGAFTGPFNAGFEGAFTRVFEGRFKQALQTAMAPRGGCGQLARQGGADARRAHQRVDLFRGRGCHRAACFNWTGKSDRARPPGERRTRRAVPSGGTAKARPGRPDSGPVSDAEDEPGGRPGAAQIAISPGVPAAPPGVP